MVELRLADASFRRLNAGVTVALCAAVVGAAYWYERAHRRWSAQNNPLTVPRARLERARITFRDRRAFVTEVAQAIRQSGLPAAGPRRSG
jgi:hypothetical protein